MHPGTHKNEKRAFGPGGEAALAGSTSSCFGAFGSGAAEVMIARVSKVHALITLGTLPLVAPKLDFDVSPQLMLVDLYRLC